MIVYHLFRYKIQVKKRERDQAQVGCFIQIPFNVIVGTFIVQRTMYHYLYSNSVYIMSKYDDLVHLK